MSVNISIKNVPAEKVELLKQRAKRNHRSLQGELLALIDEALDGAAQSIKPAMTFDDLVEQGRKAGLSTPAESVRWIREDRDR